MKLQGFLSDYMEKMGKTLQKTPINQLNAAAQILMDARADDKWIFAAGNGGSSATASHFANDFMKGLAVAGKKRFRVISLSDCTPLFSALSNDVCYQDCFYEQLVGYARPGDVLVLYSGSGNSGNIVKAADYAKEIGMKVIAFTGGDGGAVDKHCDVNCISPTEVMEEIEDTHMVWEHALVCGIRPLIEAEQQ